MVDSESAQFTATQVQQMSEIMLNGIGSQVLPSLMKELTVFCTESLFPQMKGELVMAAEKLIF